MMPTNDLARRTLAVTLGTILLVYATATIAISPRVAIEVSNVVLLSLAAGIVVAYAPGVARAWRRPLLDGADILMIGVFSSWLAVVIARGGSIIWRLMDKPVHWLDSPWWGVHIALSCAGAMCHLIAPEAVSGRVPTRQWVKIGLMVAVAVAAATSFILINLN